MGELRLIRHGETTGNIFRRLDTALPGAALTDLGGRQAVRYGLEHPGADTLLLASPALRAQQTAALIGDVWQVPVQVVDNLQEIQVGDLEGRNDPEAYQVFRETVEQWMDGHWELPLPGGESANDLVDRYIAALTAFDEVKAILARDDSAPDVAVISHGAAMRLVTRAFVTDPGAVDWRHPLANTETVRLVPEGALAPDADPRGRWLCSQFGSYQLAEMPEEFAPR